MSPAGSSGARSGYPGRGHASSGTTQLGFGGLSQHAPQLAPQQHASQQHPPQQHVPQQHTPQQHAQQAHLAQGQLSPMPPRPPRPSDNPAMGGDKGSWPGAAGDGSWASRASPLQSMHQHLPTPPRSMAGRGAGSWDDRGAPGGPDIMGSIHEGNPSPDA